MINIPKQVSQALLALQQEGYDAYIVGGCVRDNLIEKVPSDWDITTSAEPNQVLSTFGNYKTVETGIQHGTVTVIINHCHIEITTFRLEGKYTDNRRPDIVEFTKNIEDDLKRRDFTMNAIAYNQKGFKDLFGGRADIENKIIRAVGDPAERFREDALRILRAIRFSACLGFEIEENTRRAIFETKELLENISAERIGAEFNKLLMGEYAEKVLNEYAEIIRVFIPEIGESIGYAQNTKNHIYDVWHHITRAIGESERILPVRLSLFFHDLGKPRCMVMGTDGCAHFGGHPRLGAEISTQVLRRLRYDSKTIKEVERLIFYHDTMIQPDEKNAKFWLGKLGYHTLMNLIKIRKADNLAKSSAAHYLYDEVVKFEKIVNKVINDRSCYTLSQLKISGSDLIKQGCSPGKELGEILEKLLNKVISGECENNKKALLDAYKNIKKTS